MRKRRDFIRLENEKSARLIVIAAEGRDTENIYFEAMKEKLKAANIHVEVLHRDTDNSSPESVFHQICDFMSEYNIEDDDLLWIVIDKDNWKDKMLSSVAQYCQQNDNLRFCVSNPCFELWLLLHLEDVTTYTEEQLDELIANRKKTKYGPTWLKRRMKDLMGHYQESDYNAYELLAHIEEALTRAKQLDENKSDRWPQKVGTRVYLLAESIMGR